MLIGRAEICSRLERLTEAAQKGQAVSLALVGGPGIGKTALLDFAITRSSTMTVLRARGVMSERSVPFSGLSELLSPILELRQNLATPQAEALATAMAMGPIRHADRFAVCAATLGLLLEASRANPVLLAIDDGQWFDAESTEVLAFALRRLRADLIATLVTSRPGQLPQALNEIPVVEIEGLDPEAARALLATSERTFSEDKIRWFVSATGGNPLALLDLPQMLSSDDLVRLMNQSEPVPISHVLEAGYGERIIGLPLSARQGLTVAAVMDGQPMHTVGAALSACGLNLDDLLPAERQELITVAASGVMFRHPLVRSAAYQIADVGLRRAAHRHAAVGLSASSHPMDRESAVWHLSAACLEPDETLAGSLEDCGVKALERGGCEGSLLAFTRAAELSELPSARIHRLLLGASSALLAGALGKANILIVGAVQANRAEGTHDAEISHVKGLLETWNGEPAAAAIRLHAAALACRDRDPHLALRMLVDAAVAAIPGGETARALDITRLIGVLEEELEVPVRWGRLFTGILHALRGDRGAARADLDAASLQPSARRGFTQEPRRIFALGAAYSYIDAYDSASKFFDAGITAAREAGAIGHLPIALAHQAMLKYQLGAWDASFAAASESLQLAQDTGNTTDEAFALCILALVQAGRGHPEGKQSAKKATTLSLKNGSKIVEAQSFSALGMFAFGEGDLAEAIIALRRCRELAIETGVLELGHLQWAPELIEAYVRIGDRSLAQTIMLELSHAAVRNGEPLLQAWEGRCRGLLLQDEFDEAFQSALLFHDSAMRPFETARTQLCYGERLRRSRRRRESRAQLDAAWATFSNLGARRWAAKAAAELSATGQHRPPERIHPTDVLTPQELQIALQVAAGATNRGAASALFLSQKTIEYHLSHTYLKLGLRSREELTRLMENQGVTSASEDRQSWRQP